MFDAYPPLVIVRVDPDALSDSQRRTRTVRRLKTSVCGDDARLPTPVRWCVLPLFYEDFVVFQELLSAYPEGLAKLSTTSCVLRTTARCVRFVFA